MDPTTMLVPPRRLGSLLRHARVAAGRELVDLGEDCGLSAVEVDDIEHGRRELDEETLAALVLAYGIDDTGLVPARSQLIIDLDEGRIAVQHGDVDIDASYGPDAILTRYLALVYRLRDLPVGATIQLRDVDIDVLSTALSLASSDVEHRLHRLMANETDVAADQKRIRRQLLLPVVGVVIAATAVGTLVLVADSGDAMPATPAGASADAVVDAGAPRIATPAVETGEVVTDIGNGGAIEINPDN